MTALKITGLVIALIILSGIIMSYTSKRKTERQAFRLVKEVGEMEIRFYPKALMATVKTKSSSYMQQSNNQFRTLAGYIFGGNQKKEKIAMTAPVHMETDSAGSSMSFVMPAGYSLNDLPQPADSLVQLHYSDEGYYAVMKFGGYASDEKILKTEQALKQKLSELKLLSSGNFRYLGYNAPWDFIGRENEVLVKIEYSE